MKYIIIGLGSFGSPLAQKLTNQGNEVIGIDSNLNKVEFLKDKISHTICMDATDQFTVTGLPLKDTDVVIVAIGENEGANIMVTALFKNLQVKRLISRAISPLHEQVLNAIGVDEIVHPEEETAERWAKKLCFTGVVESFELNKDYSIVETKLPSKYINKTIQEINIREKYKLLVLTTIKNAETRGRFGNINKISNVQGVAMQDTVLEENDLLVLYGANKDIKQFVDQNLN